MMACASQRPVSMIARMRVILALLPLATACVADATDESQAQPAAATETRASAAEPGGQPPPPDPNICQNGQVLVVNGTPIHVPVFCTEEGPEIGDPPPERRALMHARPAEQGLAK